MGPPLPLQAPSISAGWEGAVLGRQGSGQRLSPLDSGGPWTAPSSFGRPLLQAKRSWHVPGCAGGSRGIRTGARHERRLVQEQMHAVEGAVSGTRTGLYGPPLAILGFNIWPSISWCYFF